LIVHEYASEGVPEQFSEAFALKVTLWQVVVDVGEDVGVIVTVAGATVNDMVFEPDAPLDASVTVTVG
jgi:hypothetical protein